MSATILEVDTLTVTFDTDEGVFNAVEAVSFAIAAGEVVGLVGESGCGKSVTALSILRLIPSPPGRITAGSVRFKGADLAALSAAELRRVRGSGISMIFQEPSAALSPLHRVGRQLVEALRLHRDLSRRAAWEGMQLVHEEGSKPERQRRGFHTYLGVLPWYHSFGMTCALLSSCASASRLICVPDPRAGTPPFTEVLKIVQKHRPTLMPAVPTVFMAFTNHPHLEKYDLTSLIGCFSGGAPLPPEVCRRFEERTGAVIFEGYGLSETAPVATANPTNTRQRKIGSIGFPLPGTDIKVVDLVGGTQVLPQGEDGEIAVCGPQVMKGYWNKPEEDEKAFRMIDGRLYFLTGDIGHVDEEGYIYITDRKKDMVLVGGFNVYPRDVEDILFQHPKIAIAAVVGVPDAKSGEAVKAYIQLKPGETATVEEIMAFCKENMAGYKRPKIIEFRDSLPMSNVGKVLRRMLRDEPPGKAK